MNNGCTGDLDSHDGVIDIRLDDSGSQTIDIIRMRSMRDVSFDRKWHQVEVKDCKASLTN